MPLNLEKLISSDLPKLSYEDLIQVQDALSALIRQQRENAKQDLLKELEDKASALGLTLEELLPGKAQAKRKVATKSNPPARYRNPNDPSNTWSGRGRKPKWVEEWLAGGGNLEGLKV
jgi:DNA-binding protein H-NS